MGKDYARLFEFAICLRELPPLRPVHMPDKQANQYDIKRRSSAHSAYWMSNALVPAGLVMIYRYGWGIEAVLGLLFIVIGAVGFAMNRQIMSVPLISFDGQYLLFSPSASKSGSIKMDSNAKITVRDLGLTAETIDGSKTKLEISLLDFNSKEDWMNFIEYLRHEPEITLLFDY